MRRPATDPGRELLARDPGIQRHVRRSAIAAGPLALLVAAQGYGLAAMVVALAQHGRFDSRAAAAFVVAAAARGVLNWWLERAGRRAAADAIGRLRQELIADAAHLSAARPGALRPGEVAADVVQQLPAIESYVGKFLAGGPIAVVTTVVVLVAVFLTDHLSAFLLAPTVPLLGVFMWLVGSEAGRIADQRLASLQQLGAHLLDVLRGLVDLRAHGRAAFQRSQVRAAARIYREQTMGTLRTAFLSGLVLELIAMLGTALVAVFGGVRLAQGAADLAAILPALVLAPELYAPIRRLGAGYHDAADARAALTRLAAVAQAAEEAPLAGTPGGAPAPHALDAPLRLVDVTVAGGDERPNRLSSVTAELLPGTTTALVGPSGAGKSTLAHLVLGLLPPTEGQVLAGDTSLQSVDLSGWHARAAWVPQDPVLLPATLRDNARLAAPAADDAAVLDALRDAGLAPLVADLPDGLETRLGEGGARLSSGELRRLALARAILAGAELLVLDEPTAQLDALTAGGLLRTLAELRRDRITLLITHDPELAATADQVLHLAEGRIVRVERTEGFAVPAGGCAQRRRSADVAEAAAAVEPAAVPAAPVRPSLRTALRLVAPERGARVWRQVAAAIALGMLSAVAAVAVLALSGGLIVEAATKPPVLALTAVIVMVRMFSIMRAITRYGERLQSHDAALKILETVRVRVFEHVSRHVPGKWSDRTSAAFDGAVGDVDRAADLLIRVVVPGAAAITAIAVAALVAAVFSVPAAALIAGGCLVLGTVAGALARQAGAALADTEPVRAELARDVVTALDAGPELLLSGRTDDQRARVAARSSLLERASAAHGTRGAMLGAVVAVGAAGLAAAMAFVLAPAVAAGDLVGSYSGPFAAALVLGALAAAERLEGITEAGMALPGATAAVARLAPALLEVGDDADDAAPLRPTREWLGGRAVLVAEHVAVDRGRRPVLRDVSMAVEPGEIVSVMGESGAGKSTLLLVLAGLLAPAAGAARLGPRNLTAMSDGERSGRVLLVPSAPHLFGGTLAANLRLAAPEATDGDLHRALAAVGLGEWASALPNGLETVLGEGGATASGGQRQRLGLARAILSPAPLVLLDEPASHLPEADAIAALRAVLRARPGRSAVLVSHRAAERRLATREVVLDRGVIGATACERTRAMLSAR